MRVSKKKLARLSPQLFGPQLIGHSAAALLALSGTALATLAPAVHAQDTGGAVAAPEENMEKVVVTARRRQETLQDVPVSVTAFTSDQLSKQGIPDVGALTTSLPNTTLKASRATNSTLTAFIRGVGQADPLAGAGDEDRGCGIWHGRLASRLKRKL